MTASALCLVQNGVGPFVSTPGGVDVTAGNTISIKLASTVDVTTWSLVVVGVDEVTALAPTLTDVNPVTNVVTSPSTVVTFNMPSPSGVGRAIIFRSSVNGGGAAFTSFFGIYTLTGLGFRVGAVGERLEGDPTFGWASTVNAAIRATGTGGGGGLPALASTQYAVLMEDPIGSLVFQKLNADMIDPGFAISSWSKTAPNGSQLTYRRGDGLVGMTAVASYTSGPPSIASVSHSFGGSSGVGDITPGGWAIPSPYVSASLSGTALRNGADLGSDPTMTVTLNATKSSVKQASFTITWTRDVYYGVGIAGLSTEADIEGLAGTVLSGTRTRTFTLSPSSQKVYYSYPKAYGTATFTLNGFPASFLAPTEVAVTNVNGVTSTYYLYESTNLLTGSNLSFVVT